MKRKGGWRVGHASRESREGLREIAMQLGMLGKERRAEFSALTFINHCRLSRSVTSAFFSMPLLDSLRFL